MRLLKFLLGLVCLLAALGVAVHGVKTFYRFGYNFDGSVKFSFVSEMSFCSAGLTGIGLFFIAKRHSPLSKYAKLFATGIVAIIFWVFFLVPRPTDGFVTKPRCVENLYQIQLAKELWMSDNNKTLNDTPTWDDIKAYVGGNILVCPNGGIYTIGRVDQLPTCSIGGWRHSLPPMSQDYLRKFIRENRQQAQPAASPQVNESAAFDGKPEK